MRIDRDRLSTLEVLGLQGEGASAEPGPAAIDDDAYAAILAGVTELLESARHLAARAVNSLMTATYWEIGRRIVEEEQRGRARAAYGERLIERLAQDLTTRFGRGFSTVNRKQMRKVYPEWGASKIGQTASDEFAGSIPPPAEMPRVRFPLSWSRYARLLSVENPEARAFYEAEALRGGWTVRQLDRQIGTQFYERTLLSRNMVRRLVTETCRMLGAAGSTSTAERDWAYARNWLRVAIDRMSDRP
jgi:hypothetical protein